MATSLTTTPAIKRAAKVAVSALAVVACLAVVERYFEFNPARILLLGERGDGEGGITSVYRHRIMFGYAMAAIFPFALFFAGRARGRRESILAWAVLLLTIAACYFSFSRGPWVGLLLAALLIGILGRETFRRGIKVIGAITVLALVADAGVRETVFELAASLIDTDTAHNVKASSAQYRKTLWRVAWVEISKSPERMLFGYGRNSTLQKDYSEYFEREMGGTTDKLGFTSWDSQFALNLIELGILGFLAGTILYFKLFLAGIKSWRNLEGDDLHRDLVLAAVASLGVYLWACTNVAIFNPQLTWLFLTAAALAINLGTARRSPKPEFASSLQTAPTEPQLAAVSSDAGRDGIVSYPDISVAARPPN